MQCEKSWPCHKTCCWTDMQLYDVRDDGYYHHNGDKLARKMVQWPAHTEPG